MTYGVIHVVLTLCFFGANYKPLDVLCKWPKKSQENRHLFSGEWVWKSQRINLRVSKYIGCRGEWCTYYVLCKMREGWRERGKAIVWGANTCLQCLDIRGPILHSAHRLVLLCMLAMLRKLQSISVCTGWQTECLIEGERHSSRQTEPCKAS